MFARFVLSSVVLLGSCSKSERIAIAQSSPSCERLLENESTIPVRLVSRLGSWNSCEQTAYSKSDLGTQEILLVLWDNVTLTVDFQLIETSIYIVEIKGQSPLTSQWYDSERKNLVPTEFNMNWEFDEFPGPSAEHYSSNDESTNGQIWIERGPDGAVEWMRFSYAL